MRASERGTRRARESRETPYRFSTRSLRRYAASQLLSEGLEQVTSVCKLISKMFYYYYFFFLTIHPVQVLVLDTQMWFTKRRSTPSFIQRT